MQLIGIFAINFFFPTLLSNFKVFINASCIATMMLAYMNFAESVLGSWLVTRYRQWLLMIIPQGNCIKSTYDLAGFNKTYPWLKVIT